MAVRLSVLCAGRPLPRGRFLVLISVRGRVDHRAIVRLGGLGRLKKSSALIGNPPRDLPACSIVPEPTTLPRAPLLLGRNVFFIVPVLFFFPWKSHIMKLPLQKPDTF
jgi:hypothetical protein